MVEEVPIEAYRGQIRRTEGDVWRVKYLNLWAYKVSIDTYGGVVKSYLPYVDVEIADNTVAVSNTSILHTCLYRKVNFCALLFTSFI